MVWAPLRDLSSVKEMAHTTHQKKKRGSAEIEVVFQASDSGCDIHVAHLAPMLHMSGSNQDKETSMPSWLTGPMTSRGGGHREVEQREHESFRPRPCNCPAFFAGGHWTACFCAAHLRLPLSAGALDGVDGIKPDLVDLFAVLCERAFHSFNRKNSQWENVSCVCECQAKSVKITES